jgi:Tfp pilus assembly protein PilF
VSLGLAALKQAVELDGDDALYHNGLGVAQLQLGQAKEAQAEFERAVAIDPTYAEGHHNLGLALFEQKRYEEAAQAYRKALAQPLYVTPEVGYYNLAQVCLYHLKRPREAEEALRAAVKLAPRFARAYYELGVVLSLDGRKDEARGAFRQARDLEPESPVGRAATQALEALGGGG